MTIVEERYEKAWNSFLIYLNHHPKALLTLFLEERHVVNHRTMQNWMCKKGYSVYKARKEVLAGQAEARKQASESSQTDSVGMFVPLHNEFTKIHIPEHTHSISDGEFSRKIG